MVQWRNSWLIPVFLLLVLLIACQSIAAPVGSESATKASQTLRLATTTSTADSGLLDAILPAFEEQYNAHVDVVAVGTGQALAIGANGDADVVLVHARAREDKFVADGDGINRRDVMYNDYVIVGPTADPAQLQGNTLAQEAFAKIAERQAPFASRGDDSGTHTKELSLWASAGVTPTMDSGWYLSLGQGMGETLIFANETLAYTLADRGTWLSMQENLPDLAVLVGGATIAQNEDQALLNLYGVIPVNPAKHSTVNFTLATQFAEWLTSAATQQRISAYGKDKFGQPLFYPTRGNSQ